MENGKEALIITSSAFEQGGFIPAKYTGRGEDISPELSIANILYGGKSIAIIMNDNDHPLAGYNHWVIWNIPLENESSRIIIPENIPFGANVDFLNGAVQGIGYGKHRYRGPKPPLFMRSAHYYQFHVYVLDCMLELDSSARKKNLLQNMEGHILQYGSLTGKFSNENFAQTNRRK